MSTRNRYRFVPNQPAAEVLEARRLLAAVCKVNGLNFSPYIGPGENPNFGDGQITNQELYGRLQTIAPYTSTIRTFGCNEDLKEAGQFAHQLGMRSVLSAWISADTASNQAQIDCLVTQALAGHADEVLVGSETQYRGDISESTLISYINQVSDRLQAGGRGDIPVSTADTYAIFLGRPALVSAADKIYANIYPFWEGYDINAAVAQVSDRYQQLRATYPTKEVVISETGWPSAGQTVGSAVPSPANAAKYFRDFVAWAGANNVPYLYFEAYDQPWKTQEGTVGPNWGVWTSSQLMKPGMDAGFACPPGGGDPADYTSDGKADCAVFRPAIGQWFVLDNTGPSAGVPNASNGVRWGLPGDLPAQGDFTGDGKSDFAVYRPSLGRWYVLANPVSPAVVHADGIQWGLPCNGAPNSCDQPVAADYSGDGKTDYAVYRPSSGQWFVLTNTGPPSHGAIHPANGTIWGLPGDLPVPGDYTGDGKADFAIYRPSSGQWWVQGYAQGLTLGQQGDVPVPCDFTGDGKADYAVFRPATGQWFLRDNIGPGLVAPVNPSNGFQWGLPGDLPVPADYSGDGRVDFGVYRPSLGRWYVLLNPVSPPVIYAGGIQWGIAPGDRPVGYYKPATRLVLPAATISVSSSASTASGFAAASASLNKGATVPFPFTSGDSGSIHLWASARARLWRGRRLAARS